MRLCSSPNKLSTMLENILRIIIAFIIIFNCVNSENLMNKNDKLPPGGLQLCLDSFDVHKDKIIRTQDSLALGAKYIMESEVDDRKNCLKSCCETNDCDVFIFEEKKHGSCYLFRCGPPHDFKCKFTSHGNYTSAVLTNLSYRNSPYIEQNGRSQQEHELKSLRKITNSQLPSEYIYTESPSLVVTETQKPIILTTQLPIKTGCSRNQYECRISGDCIAIYNVCDGIPQCTDGSDEAAELGCPTEKPTPPPPIIPPMIPPPPPDMIKYPDALEHRKTFQTFYGNSESASKSWPLPVAHQVSSQPEVQYPPQMPANYGGQEYLGGWQYRQIYEQNRERYPINQIHIKGDMPHYGREQQPHIFNHKRPGVIPENGEGTGYVEPERSYDAYYPGSNHPIPSQIMHIEPKPAMIPTSPPIIPKQELDPVAEEQPVPKSDAPIKLNPSIKKELETQKNVHHQTQNKVEKDVSIVKQQAVKKDTEPTKGETPNNKSETHHKEERMHHFIAEHLKQSNRKETDEVLRPRGAVISLALGLTVTAIMAALIGCRLRVVRKRGRRGHGPYAHDADYLVNGMYL